MFEVATNISKGYILNSLSPHEDAQRKFLLSKLAEVCLKKQKIVGEYQQLFLNEHSSDAKKTLSEILSEKLQT